MLVSFQKCSLNQKDIITEHWLLLLFYFGNVYNWPIIHKTYASASARVELRDNFPCWDLTMVARLESICNDE